MHPNDRVAKMSTLALVTVYFACMDRRMWILLQDYDTKAYLDKLACSAFLL